MMKRVTWFVGGIAAGALGASAAKKKVKNVAKELAPVQVAQRAGGSVREQGRRVTDAVREGRRAMRSKELELRARIEGRSSALTDELEGIDAVLVDGHPVEPGQVIVLKQVRDDRPGRRKRA
ncbi:MAG: hypothetical protein RI958_3206 [Actinomycetota bacterium]|jgi:hypothetical protein